jgi:hypothetical protein
VEGGVAAAVVTDGCGSGASSEVGARLGACFLAQRMPGLVREMGLGPALAERAAQELLEWVREVVKPLDVEGSQLPQLIAEQWLFTFLCAVMDSKSAMIFGVGDGLWRADAVGAVLEAGADNAPDYLSYRLVPSLSGAGVPVVHFFGQAQQLAVATDGLAGEAASLESFTADATVWRNPVALQRRLRLMRLLHDDTTVALLKRSA